MERSIAAFTVWNWFLFGVTIVFILTMTLIGRDSLNELYLFCAQVLSLEDIVLSFAGILLASTMILFVKGQWNKKSFPLALDTKL